MESPGSDGVQLATETQWAAAMCELLEVVLHSLMYFREVSVAMGNDSCVFRCHGENDDDQDNVDRDENDSDDDDEDHVVHDDDDDDDDHGDDGCSRVGRR
jgi:ABC-type Zn2+ transport system substrate-binding protein/surface adhesin